MEKYKHIVRWLLISRQLDAYRVLQSAVWSFRYKEGIKIVEKEISFKL